MTSGAPGCASCLTLSMQVVRLRAQHRALLTAVEGLESALRTFRRAREVELGQAQAECEVFAAYDRLVLARKGGMAR